MAPVVLCLVLERLRSNPCFATFSVISNGASEFPSFQPQLRAEPEFLVSDGLNLPDAALRGRRLRLCCYFRTSLPPWKNPLLAAVAL